MQVLLLQDVRKLGHLGDVVNVKPGYARNFLVPQRLATEPTEDNIRAIANAKEKAAVERAVREKEYRALAERMKDVSVTIEANANPEGTLYGAVHAADVAAALHAAGFPVTKDQVMLYEPIRQLDNRMIRVEFSDEVTAEVKVWVVRSGETPAAADTEDAADGRESPAEEAAEA